MDKPREVGGKKKLKKHIGAYKNSQRKLISLLQTVHLLL